MKLRISERQFRIVVFEHEQRDVGLANTNPGVLVVLLNLVEVSIVSLWRR